MVEFKMKGFLPTGRLSMEMPPACQFSGPSKSPSFKFQHFSFFQPILTVNSYTHHLSLNKSPNLYQELKIQSSPNSTYCLLPSTDKELEQEDNLELNTVNYLKESGFVEEDAIYVAKRIIIYNKSSLKIAAKANKFLAILREFGFSSAQIIRVVKTRPNILLASPSKVIFPKLEFLESIGFERGTSLGEIVAKDPSLLNTSLEKKLRPSYEVVKEVLDSDYELVLKVIKKGTRLIQVDLRTTLIPNIEALRDAGVPKSNIDYMIFNNSAPLTEKHSKFRQAVIWVKEMGFDPTKITFIQAVVSLSWKCYPSVWVRCYEIFLELGCSDDEIIRAFKVKPFYMMVSDKKIKMVVDCLVNKLGWPSTDIKQPSLFIHSLEKRIIPRCSVVLYLHSKGLLKKNLPKLTKLVAIHDRIFIKKYLTGYAETVPEVLKIFKGELNFLGEREKY